MTRAGVAFAIGLREHARNYLLVALLLALPVLFITLSFEVTQDVSMPVRTIESGETTTVSVPMPAVHGVIMTPITSALIAGLAGLFLMNDAQDADGRLVVAGYETRQLVVARLGVLTVISAVVTAVAVGVMLVDFTPEHVAPFVVAMFLLTVLYGLLGMLVGAAVDRLAGLWVMLTVPMLDIGLFQDPLFVQSAPDWWMKLLPGYHPVRVMVDVGVTAQVDTLASLGWTLGYLSVVVGLVVVVFGRLTVSQR
ncbi:hypothetical protein GCM10028857_19360 [Salinarchaeum chitinilyticum]